MKSLLLMAISLGIVFVIMSIPRLKKWLDIRKKKETYEIKEAKVEAVESASRGRLKVIYSFKSKNKKGKKVSIKESFYTRDIKKFEYGDKFEIYVHPRNAYLCFVEQQVSDARNRFLGYIIGGVVIMVVLPLISFTFFEF